MARLIVLVFAALSEAGVTFAYESFSYEHQDQWNGVYCRTGSYQSPVNIRTEDLRSGSEVYATNLVFQWPFSVKGTFLNNGHTVKFTPDIGQPTAFTTTKFGRCKLLQIHMHWGENNGVGSEHRINGEQASLEIHFVHEMETTISGPGSWHQYVVVAVLADAGSESSSSVFNYLPLRSIQPYNTRIAIPSLPLNYFIPTDHSYYHYHGSLTTPMCDQTVEWFVLKDRISVPRSYLALLRTMQKDGHGNVLEFNYRDPQQLYVRHVYEHDDRTM